MSDGLPLRGVQRALARRMLEPRRTTASLTAWTNHQIGELP
jgi:hypothetical protein